MLVAAAVCPGPPLLVPELTGPDPAADALRAAGTRAVADLLAAAPDRVAVVGAGDRTVAWPADAVLDCRSYGGFGPPPMRPVAPLSVGLGAYLLDQAGWSGDRLLWTVTAEADHPAVAATLVGGEQRVALLVIADGTARRTLKAPGYLDDRAGPYDAAVEQALSTGDIAALTTVDRRLAAELMASGWAALQVLAAAVGTARVETALHYAGAPYGVGYLVASLHPAG